MHYTTRAILSFSGDDLEFSGEHSSFAALLNQRIMFRLAEALKSDPETDLATIIPHSYQAELARAKQQAIQGAAPASLSETGTLNYETLDTLTAVVYKNPEVDLFLEFPLDYTRKRDQLNRETAAQEHSATNIELSSIPDKTDKGQLHIFSWLNDNDTVTIISPLSDVVTGLLSENAPSVQHLQSPAQSLLQSLKKTIQKSEKLFDYAGRAVFRCNDEIVLKVVQTVDLTEYSTLQFLVREVPDFPAPKPHGLIACPNWKAIFMSYIPSMTLTKAWPLLGREEKLSVQNQLNDLLRKLRRLRQPDGRPLGGVGGEGAKDHRMLDHKSDSIIKSTTEFENFQFSVAHGGSDAYIKFLRSFLPPPGQTAVFTHSDLRKDNILVQIDTKSKEVLVTGIIDWEDSGFYPDYHECIKATANWSAVEEDDWYQFLPPSISPSKFPINWLVDRLWEICINYSR